MTYAETASADKPLLFLLTVGEPAEPPIDLATEWRVTRAGNADAFDAGDAIVALVDARGAADAGLAATCALAGPAEKRGAALLALVSPADADRIGAFHAAGATQFLVEPASAAELVQALRFAARHVERVGAGRVGGWNRGIGPADEPRRRAIDDPALPLKRRSDRAPAPADARLDALGRDLRRALGAGEIEVRFQPQVAIGSGAITGVEALARWYRGKEEIGAEPLFAAAAHAGLDGALSAHVQVRALETAARWPAALSALRLSINVTAADVARPGFADMLLDRVDASGFPRERLTVEITENGLIEELGEAARLLAQLRIAGCRVAIDDFGTGYSSLAYLKALPLDYLKIDRRLSQDITGSARDRVVVRSVIDMAQSLGLAVVAEGVETEEQLELLAKKGCQYFQGFLCAGPLDVPALVALVEGA